MATQTDSRLYSPDAVPLFDLDQAQDATRLDFGGTLDISPNGYLSPALRESELTTFRDSAETLSIQGLEAIFRQGFGMNSDDTRFNQLHGHLMGMSEILAGLAIQSIEFAEKTQEMKKIIDSLWGEHNFQTLRRLGTFIGQQNLWVMVDPAPANLRVAPLHGLVPIMTEDGQLRAKPVVSGRGKGRRKHIGTLETGTEVLYRPIMLEAA